MSAPTLPKFTTRVLPVVALDDATHALALAQSLLDGGVDAIEITLRTPTALTAIEAIARALPAMCVGAGTVQTAADLRRVQNAGARFALSPGTTPTLLAAAATGSLPFVPGVASASEAMQAQDAGFSLVKLFPAEPLGGPGLLAALAGPFPQLRFCPTGGLTAENAPRYLCLPNVALVGGSWLTPHRAVSDGNWDHIRALARAARAL